MVSFLDHMGAMRDQDPLAQVGGLTLEFVTRMVPCPLAMCLIQRRDGGYSMVTVKSDPILSSIPNQVGEDYIASTEESDPIRDMLAGHRRAILAGREMIEAVPSFPDSRLKSGFLDEYSLGTCLVLGLWDEASGQHCLMFLARSVGESEFTEREKGFLRHAAPLLTQSCHDAIRLGGLAAPLSGTLAAELTPRELEIARMAAHGAKNPDIAAHLHIAPGTVKCHMHSIYGKLGDSSRVHLALALGLAT